MNIQSDKCLYIPDECVDILLIVAPPLLVESAPLGVAYLSEYIRSQGYRVHVIDFNKYLYQCANGADKKWWDIAALGNYSGEFLGQELQNLFAKEMNMFIEQLSNRPERLIGFSTTTASIIPAMYVAHQVKLKNPHKITILGGPGTYGCYDAVDTRHLVDLFVIGEGEHPIVNIIAQFKEDPKRKNLLGIKGTSMWFEDKYHTFLPQDHISHLDEIPFPSFSDFNLNEYKAENNYCYIPLLTSRGCINRCSYCIDCHMNFPYRCRSAEHVFNEINYHIKKNNIHQFQFNDLLCNGNLKQLEKLCDLIIQENLFIQWTSYAAIRTGMSITLLEKMKKAGCMYLCYGVESGSDYVLKNMNKNYTAQQAEEVIKNTSKVGIRTAINIILGFPGDNEFEFRKTCRFIKRNFSYIDEITNISTWFFMNSSDIGSQYRSYKIHPPYTIRNLKKKLRGETIEMDFRHFHAFPFNTPRIRKSWLRRFVKLVYQLGVINRIINRIGEDDKTFEEFLIVLKKKYAFVLGVAGKCTAAAGNLLCVVDKKRRDTALFYNPTGKKWKIKKKKKPKVINLSHCTIFSCGVGCNTSFCVGEKWYDSSMRETTWNYEEKNNTITISIVWRSIPFKQIWYIADNGKGMQWHITTSHDVCEDICAIKAGILVSKEYNRFLYKNQWHSLHNEVKNDWQDINLDSQEVIVSALPHSNVPLPVIYMKSESNKDISMQLQTAPIYVNARMINVCHFIDMKKHLVEKENRQENVEFDVLLECCSEKTIGF